MHSRISLARRVQNKYNSVDTINRINRSMCLTISEIGKRSLFEHLNITSLKLVYKIWLYHYQVMLLDFRMELGQNLIYSLAFCLCTVKIIVKEQWERTI